MNQASNTSKKTLVCGGYLLNTALAEFQPGELLLSGSVIAAVGAPGTLPREDAEIWDVNGAYITPGLIDIHSHGRAGGDFVTADVPLLCKMSRSYLDAGVTTVMPTMASAPFEDFPLAAERIRRAAATADGARLLGLHLEGRYLNPKKRGAHASLLLAPLDADELTALHAKICCNDNDVLSYNQKPTPMRLSAALECDADGSFTATAKQLGIVLSLGHTEANYQQAKHILSTGVNCFTHLFNAMPPLHHRDGGAVAACFDSTAYGEIICDGFHIAPHMVRMAYRLLGRERTVLISDSMEGTGCPDGNYNIAGMDVIVQDGKAYTTDGAIAGSTLGLLDAVRNLASFCDIPLAHAFLCATINPARAAGIDDFVGSLTPGHAADLLILDIQEKDITLTDTLVGGIRKGGLTA